MSDPEDPLSSSPARLRRLADELDDEGQADLAQATRRAADAAERDGPTDPEAQDRGDAAPQPRR